MEGVSLDNEIFLLQKTKLPPKLAEKLLEADILFLQDKEEESAKIVRKIKEECDVLGIEIAGPSKALSRAFE